MPSRNAWSRPAVPCRLGKETWAKRANVRTGRCDRLLRGGRRRGSRRGLRLERGSRGGGGTTSREPVARVPAVDVQQVMCHRTWGALLATDCEPQRHSLMVLGRPAQAA